MSGMETVSRSDLRRTYNSWFQMVGRCTRKHWAVYARYGARGISVCERWRDSFAAFVEDMGIRPDGTTIDRIDGTGNYEPSNCRWATHAEQNRNTSRNRWVEFGGVRMVEHDWAACLGIDPAALRNRIRRHGVDIALGTPALARGQQIAHPSRHVRHIPTGYMGVYRNKNRFESRIKVGGKTEYLGLFVTAEEAAEAWNRRAIETRGNGAKLNTLPEAVKTA